MPNDSLSNEAALLLALSNGNTPTQAMAEWCAEYAQVHGVSENAARQEYWITCLELEAK